jgi:hypothetical protein
MSHKLEEYLKRERDNLDVESPDDNSVWDSIEQKLAEKAKESTAIFIRIRWNRIRNIAAAVLIIFCLGYITKDLINTISAGRNVSLSSIDSGLGQREKQYRTIVNLKAGEVNILKGSENEIVRELFGELAGLDTIYVQSMADLRVLGPNVKVINTIFDTYEQKIRLLELIILETNKSKIHENNEEIEL